jgi:hypothetical protein
MEAVEEELQLLERLLQEARRKTRQHTSAYVSTRQHTLGQAVSIRQHTHADVC